MITDFKGENFFQEKQKAAIIHGEVLFKHCQEHLIAYWLELLDKDGKTVLYCDLLDRDGCTPDKKALVYSGLVKWLCRGCDLRCEGKADLNPDGGVFRIYAETRICFGGVDFKNLIPD